MSIQKEATSQQEREILGIIDSEASAVGYGSLSLELMIKDGKIIRVETSITKKSYKV